MRPASVRQHSLGSVSNHPVQHYMLWGNSLSPFEQAQVHNSPTCACKVCHRPADSPSLHPRSRIISYSRISLLNRITEDRTELQACTLTVGKACEACLHLDLQILSDNHMVRSKLDATFCDHIEHLGILGGRHKDFSARGQQPFEASLLQCSTTKMKW